MAMGKRRGGAKATKAQGRADAAKGAQRRARKKGTWGGARKGAGRKPGPRPAGPHRARPRHLSTQPVLVTLRAEREPLADERAFAALRLAILRSGRRTPERFRVVHFAVQGDEVKLIVEASNAGELSAALRSVTIRIARYVNDAVGRKGPFWIGRWRGRALRSARDVREALVSVLANVTPSSPAARSDFNSRSSAEWFDGWKGYTPARVASEPSEDEVGWDELTACPVLPPRTRLLRTDWRELGLIAKTETPPMAARASTP